MSILNVLATAWLFISVAVLTIWCMGKLLDWINRVCERSRQDDFKIIFPDLNADWPTFCDQVHMERMRQIRCAAYWEERDRMNDLKNKKIDEHKTYSS